MMPALATLTLVWLGAQKPEGRAKIALDAWAESQGAKLEEPRSTPPEDIEKSVTLSAQCDQALDRARDQSNSGDAEAARQTLRQLEQTLRDHPELLQAAWLMAERYRLEAQIAAHGTNPTAESSADDALAWDRRADILEGERATAFGARPRATKAPDSVTVTLAVHGARRYEVLWDGVSATDRIASLAGEHHVVIRRGGRAAWSGWISVLASGTVDVWVPDADAVLVGRSGRRVARCGRRAGGAERGALRGMGGRSAGLEPGHASNGAVQRRSMSTRGDLGVRNVRDVRCRRRTTEEERFAGWAAWTIARRRGGGGDDVRLVGKRSFRPRQIRRTKWSGRRLLLLEEAGAAKVRRPSPRGVRSADHRRSLGRSARRAPSERRRHAKERAGVHLVLHGGLRRCTSPRTGRPFGRATTAGTPNAALASEAEGVPSMAPATASRDGSVNLHPNHCNDRSEPTHCHHQAIARRNAGHRGAPLGRGRVGGRGRGGASHVDEAVRRGGDR